MCSYSEIGLSTCGLGLGLGVLASFNITAKRATTQPRFTGKMALKGVCVCVCVCVCVITMNDFFNDSGIGTSDLPWNKS